MMEMLSLLHLQQVKQYLLQLSHLNLVAQLLRTLQLPIQTPLETLGQLLTQPMQVIPLEL
jgi:hypothetical protein